MYFKLIQDIERIRRNHLSLIKSEEERIERVKGYTPVIKIIPSISDKAKANIKKLICEDCDEDTIKDIYTDRVIGLDFKLGRDESLEYVMQQVKLAKVKDAAPIDFENIEPF